MTYGRPDHRGHPSVRRRTGSAMPVTKMLVAEISMAKNARPFSEAAWTPPSSESPRRASGPETAHSRSYALSTSSQVIIAVVKVVASNIAASTLFCNNTRHAGLDERWPC